MASTPSRYSLLQQPPDLVFLFPPLLPRRVRADKTRRSMSHITVERNRRKQMNEHLKVLRSLTPCFYIKRSDQASIIAGVIEFIKELHQVLESLESKKKRKRFSPSPGPSPRQSTPPLDHINPSTLINSETVVTWKEEMGASCNSSLADVEAKISGSNVILRTISKRKPGQLVKIIRVLETHSLEITHLNISSMDDTVLYSFVMKIGLECQLSLEEVVLEVQQTFSQVAALAIQL
ncbi:hypothetical protein H6P81_002495 [Aristolochia fimbriata]|uniref:BHLH domain-containing protein n=1 Tax=Aristolochia fimbriata TaxID=158543 RepID=A0AAV7F9X4_ARIFI|nr:hypothetical protein H6P81_002495 [Aristolochia fimbriata]